RRDVQSDDQVGSAGTLPAQAEFLAVLDAAWDLDFELAVVDLEADSASECSDLEGYGGVGFDLGRRPRPGPASRACSSAEQVLEATAAKHVAEHLGGHFGIALELKVARPAAPPVESAWAARTAAGAGEAELIVLRPAFLIAEHVVGFLHFLESGFGLFVAWIAVRVMLPGELAIGFLDLILRGAFLEAQCFIIVAGHSKSAAGVWSCGLSGFILALWGARAKAAQPGGVAGATRTRNCKRRAQENTCGAFTDPVARIARIFPYAPEVFQPPNIRCALRPPSSPASRSPSNRRLRRDW